MCMSDLIDEEEVRVDGYPVYNESFQNVSTILTILHGALIVGIPFLITNFSESILGYICIAIATAITKGIRESFRDK